MSRTVPATLTAPTRLPTTGTPSSSPCKALMASRVVAARPRVGSSGRSSPRSAALGMTPLTTWGSHVAPPRSTRAPMPSASTVMQKGTP